MRMGGVGSGGVFRHGHRVTGQNGQNENCRWHGSLQEDNLSKGVCHRQEKDSCGGLPVIVNRDRPLTKKKPVKSLIQFAFD